MNRPDLPPSQTVGSTDTLWGADLRPAGCPHCRQAHLVPASQLGAVCPNCARGKLESQPVVLRAEPPELLVPFAKSRADLRSILSPFAGAVWLRPDDFDAEKLLQRATPVYLPMWLVDSDVAGDWQAEMGFDYQVKSSRESYGGGGWQTQEVIETRVRWEPRVGQLQRHYDNVAVPALANYQLLQRLIGDQPLRLAQPYNPAQLVGSAIRVPDLPPESAWPQAQTILNGAAGGECQQAASAQHLRNFAIRADHESLHWTQLLLPIYFTYYTDDDGQPHPIFVNGQSGKIGGARRASQRKGWLWAGIIAAVALAIFVVGVILALAGALFPPLVLLGGLIAFVGLFAGALALVPAMIPWMWNRNQ